MVSSKPVVRYRDIRRNIAKIREYVPGGGGVNAILTQQGMAYDAIRMCFLEISEAAVKLGALAELHEPDIPWSAIRGFGNHLRHMYDELDINAVERALTDLDRLDAACARAIARLDAGGPALS
ncbi:MAG: HepT-like ribonuclease domain-containing protein [Steroidobacteraceae bacterium]